MANVAGDELVDDFRWNLDSDVAKSRYARGEISKEEFEQLKKDLS